MTPEQENKYIKAGIPHYLYADIPKYLKKFYDKDGNLVSESISYFGNIHYARGCCRWLMTIPPNKHYHSFTVKRIGKKELLEFHKRQTQPELFT